MLKALYIQTLLFLSVVSYSQIDTTGISFNESALSDTVVDQILTVSKIGLINESKYEFELRVITHSRLTNNYHLNRFFCFDDRLVVEKYLYEFDIFQDEVSEVFEVNEVIINNESGEFPDGCQAFIDSVKAFGLFDLKSFNKDELTKRDTLLVDGELICKITEILIQDGGINYFQFNVLGTVGGFYIDTPWAYNEFIPQHAGLSKIIRLLRYFQTVIEKSLPRKKFIILTDNGFLNKGEKNDISFYNDEYFPCDSIDIKVDESVANFYKDHECTYIVTPISIETEFNVLDFSIYSKESGRLIERHRMRVK